MTALCLSKSTYPAVEVVALPLIIAGTVVCSGSGIIVPAGSNSRISRAFFFTAAYTPPHLRTRCATNIAIAFLSMIPFVVGVVANFKSCTTATLKTARVEYLRAMAKEFLCRRSYREHICKSVHACLYRCGSMYRIIVFAIRYEYVVRHDLRGQVVLTFRNSLFFMWC